MKRRRRPRRGVVIFRGPFGRFVQEWPGEGVFWTWQGDAANDVRSGTRAVPTLWDGDRVVDDVEGYYEAITRSGH